ncbi:MAG: hypothetical protein NC489_20445 [Ruminococcus flavefaciens]|nr:hypothetical protein [Ruminococcus flavefaciens]
MKLYAKASLDINEIKEKVRCGCDGIEYNLTKEFMLYGGSFADYYPGEIFRAHNVEVVHVPYMANKQMMHMEHIFQHKDYSAITNVFCLAQYCAEIWHHRVLVVIHCGLSMYDFMEYELFREVLENRLNDLLDKYPMVDMAIENVVAMEYKPDRKEMPRLCNGLFRDIVEIVGYLRARFGERVGSVLDTCHAMMTEKYMSVWLKEADFYPKEGEEFPEKMDYSLEKFFEANSGICKLIHFNDFTGNGYQINHGTAFTSQTKVDHLLGLYRKYGYDCPLTLEIREDDYENCVNFRSTKKMIEDNLRRNGVCQ